MKHGSSMHERTLFAAVLGSPIAHSKSPAMHQAVYEYLDVPLQYERIEVTQHQADEFMQTLNQRFGSTRQLAGFSVTMPLKSVLVPHMEHISERVERLGVLNTVVYDSAGIAHGYNTDVDGIRQALTKSGFEPRHGGSMAILGAGGTATAAVAAAAEMQLDAVVLYVRNKQRAEDTKTIAARFGLSVDVQHLTDFAQEAGEHRAVVATLPAHAADPIAAQLPRTQLPPLLDVIYDPWPTNLAAAWHDLGGEVASGLDMLLYQGVEQAKLFTQKLLGQRQIDWRAATRHMAKALGLAEM